MKKINKKSFLIILAILLISVLLSLFFMFKDRLGFILGEFDDTVPPELVSLDFSTRTIDTDDAEVEVTVTFVVSDDMSGVASAYFYMQPTSLSDDSNGQIRGIDFLERVSGDKYLGTYSGVITFPRYSANGEWYITPNTGNFHLADEVGNVASLTEAQVMDVLDVNQSMVRINNTATMEDISAPELKSLTVQTEYKTFSTESSDAEVKITFVVEDDFAGIESISNLGVHTRICPINEAYIGQEKDFVFEVTNTNGLEKTYEGVATIPKGSMNGNWRVWNFYMKDSIGNDTTIEYATLLDIYGGSNLWANNTATVYDNVPPTIKSFSVSQSEFNTSAGEVVLDVEIEIEDPFSGIKPDVIGFSIHPLIGTQSNGRGIANVTKKSGDDFSAVYQGTVTFPQYSKVGIWEINMGAQDKIGNRLNCEGARIGDSCDATQLFPDNPAAILYNTAISDEVTVDRECDIKLGKCICQIPRGYSHNKERGRVVCIIQNGYAGIRCYRISNCRRAH